MDPNAYTRRDGLLALWDASWPMGRIAGIRIRFRWNSLLFLLLGVGSLVSQGLSWGHALAEGLLFFVVLYVVILTHELGHAWAAHRVGAPVREITLHLMGGLAHVSRPYPGPRAEIGVALAGPAVHLLWLGPAWLLREHGGALVLGDFALHPGHLLHRMNLALLLFNLLPCYPMDGGSALRGLLALRMHPNRATIWACRIGILGAIGIGAWGLERHGVWGSMLVVIAISNFLTCLRELTAARHSYGPYGAAADPWETDPDAWKSAPKDRGAPRDERLWPRVLRGRAASGPRREDAAIESASTATATVDAPAVRTPEEDAELDRLLERVGEVGLTGLSSAERERLQFLSRHPKKRP